MESEPIFYDPHGKRRLRMSRFTTVVSTVAAVSSTVFAILLCFTIPSLSNPAPKAHKPGGLLTSLPENGAKASILFNSKARRDLLAEIAKSRLPSKKPPVHVDKIVAGFYAPWEESGIHSLNAFKDHLTHVIPSWLSLGQDGQTLDVSDFDLEQNPTNQRVLDIAHSAGLRIVPLLRNSKGDDWDPKSVHTLLGSPSTEANLVNRLLEWVLANKFQGINIDFESMETEDYAKLPAFVKLLHDAFQPKNLGVSVDIEAENANVRAKELADAADWLMLMAYDQHSETDPPGAIAGVDWCETVLEATLKRVPAEKLVLGIGNYAYDWNTKTNAPADSLSFNEAMDTADGYSDDPPSKVIQFDKDSLNSTFSYEDDSDDLHKVWILDAASAYNQWLSARGYGLRGAAVWALGQEDPGIWSFLGPNMFTADMHTKSLETVKFPYFISNEGKGEILRVADFPKEGSRTLKTDSDGLIVNELYDEYAFPYVLQHSGYSPRKLCLTFDDGPDPTYTPEILDVLKDLQAPAAFFIVGKNAEEHSNLVQREYDEGHEVGNHTFTHPDLGAIGPFRAELEINATQRVIETIVGKSTILFRPPYNADSEPSNKEELEPVTLAAKLHYVTVGEKVDPQDWNLSVPTADGGLRPKTADDIVADVVSQIQHFRETKDEGNIILLHDAGGNRDATVAALKILVPSLRSQGYQFVSVASLMGKTRDQVMPDPPASDRLAIQLSRIEFGTVFTIDRLLAIGFLAAIWLGFARIVLITPLALVDHFRQRRFGGSPGFRPEVSVLIAAYNEETVIARTVSSALGSNYPVKDVIVVDDGSSDGTSKSVVEAFGADPRVRLLRRPNGGKAAALNDAIAACNADLMFSVDADTQIDPNALGLLVRHFEDPTVAAVAGNVKVGNQVNILTQWQAVEYTTSQNIDRRAYALMNSITVVPGAIGVWRRKAVIAAGSYISDTLAEDMDLTWRLRRAGHRLKNEPGALAYTEAPQSFGAFFKQRFRWAYGTLQCLFKHRRGLFHHGFFGWLALPTLWLFQIVFQALAPLVDLQVLYSIAGYAAAYLENRQNPGAELSSLPAASSSLAQVGMLYVLFFLAELGSGFIAYRLDREKYGALWWLFLQRFAYRQIMYGVVYKSMLRAIGGTRQGWGKLDRKGTVNLPK